MHPGNRCGHRGLLLVQVKFAVSLVWPLTRATRPVLLHPPTLGSTRTGAHVGNQRHHVHLVEVVRATHPVSKFSTRVIHRILNTLLETINQFFRNVLFHSSYLY